MSCRLGLQTLSLHLVLLLCRNSNATSSHPQPGREETESQCFPAASRHFQSPMRVAVLLELTSSSCCFWLLTSLLRLSPAICSAPQSTYPLHCQDIFPAFLHKSYLCNPCSKTQKKLFFEQWLVSFFSRPSSLGSSGSSGTPAPWTKASVKHQWVCGAVFPTTEKKPKSTSDVTQPDYLNKQK